MILKSKEYYDIYELQTYLAKNLPIKLKDIKEAFRKYARNMETNNGSLITLYTEEYISVSDDINNGQEDTDSILLTICRYLYEQHNFSEIQIHYWW